ncbi:MAG: DUF4160 domain-containing protein [Candidatus Bipolaricaulia bacterium]
MPTVARDGEFAFIVHTRELPFEPPHVHVVFGGDEVRIELGANLFMEAPPEGKRRAILKAYERHVDEIRRIWEEIHGSLEEG